MTPAVRRRVQRALSRCLADPDESMASVAGVGAVHRLERRFASLTGQPHAVAVANATLGLWAVLRGLDVHDADVITTPYTWGGSLAGIIQNGNRPVFADVDNQTLTLDPASVVERITPRTKAILLVDIYGYPCHGPAFREIADAHGLFLVQDCAQSFGAFLGGHHTGFWADAAVFSFTWGKALYAGEGGIVVTRHTTAFEQMVRQTQHPMRQRRDVPGLAPNEFALNLRINPLAAAWALAAFDAAVATVDRTRGKSMKVLEALFEAHASRTTPVDPAVTRPSFQVLTVEPRVSAERLYATLRERGLPASFSAPPVRAPLYSHAAYHELAASRGWPAPSRCRVAEIQCRRRLRLRLTAEADRSARRSATLRRAAGSSVECGTGSPGRLEKSGVAMRRMESLADTILQ